jgi:adenylate cyclase
MTYPDFAAAGLLEGLPDDQARAGRLHLLEQLHRAGFELEDLRQAVAENRLALLAAERALTGDARYTVQEVAELSGVPAEYLVAARRALGISAPDPDAKAYDERDVEDARIVAKFRAAGLADVDILEISRVTGQALARVAESITAVTGRALRREGDTELDLALRYARAAEELAPLVGPLLEHDFNMHLRESIRNAVVDAATIADGTLPGTAEVTVCFADLVGFTRLGESLPVEELGAVAGRLADIAGDTTRPPVRVIKTIGDAVMLVSPDPTALVLGALDLVAAAEAQGEDFPALRAGLDLGPAVNRWGDWYGHPVNVASRVTGVARPSSVLATRAVREASDPAALQWSRARSRHLKGVSEPVALFRARRPSLPDAPA